MPTFTDKYDSRAEAEQARQEHSRAGDSSGDVTIHDQESAGFDNSSGSSLSGSSGGGFFNSLREMFVPDEDSQTYGEGLRRGHYLLTVRATDANADEVHRILESSSAVDVDERSSSWRNEGWSGPAAGGFAGGSSSHGMTSGASMGSTTQGLSSGTASTGNEQVIPIVEEQLAVGKREVARGGVRVRSYVQETPVHEQVSLREEHVDVERRAVNEPLRSGDLADAFQERSFEMTETAEEAVVAKNARVVEEVVVHKDVSEHVEQIDDTVRRTEVDVDQIGTERTGTERTGTDRGALFNDGTDRTGR